MWPEHAWAWEVYLGCATQWIKTPVMGSLPWWEGLNYTGVEVVMRKYQVPEDMESEVFAQLQVLEVETVVLRNQ